MSPGGALPPPDPLDGGGGKGGAPLQCVSTRRTSCLRKLMGWVLWLTSVGGVLVVEMQL